MKRNILAVVIPALLAAGAVNAAEIYNKDGNKLDLYGKVTGLHYFSSNGDNDGDKTSARIGVKGETQIDSELTGFGQFEYEMKANRTENEGGKQYVRVAFAGLKFGDFGSLDYGRNYGVMYDTAAWTDMLPEFGGDTAQTDVYMQQRATGLLTYRNTNFFGMVEGLNFALQYQGKNEKASAEIKGTADANRKDIYSNGDGFGLAATYDIGWGVSAGASYFSATRSEKVRAGYQGAAGKRAEGYSTALKYDASNINPNNGLYLAAMYSELQNTTTFDSTYIANKTRNFEVVAQYQFDFGLRPSVAYIQSKAYDLNVDTTVHSKDSADLVKYVEVGTTYYFNKNMSTYVDYKINLLKKDKVPANIATDNVVAVGMTYQF